MRTEPLDGTRTEPAEHKLAGRLSIDRDARLGILGAVGAKLDRQRRHVLSRTAHLRPVDDSGVERTTDNPQELEAHRAEHPSYVWEEGGQVTTGRAVVYVHGEPVEGQPDARYEGRRFAVVRGLAVSATLADPPGVASPQDREGWQQVRAMAARGEADTVIVRWAETISPDHEQRHAEIAHLQECGVRVLFSWPRLSGIGAEGR
ncbi:hypothetical protein ACGFMM_24990 [Streptomyces sp. NPDC048604]|uniref:hypothetical protein n=1 Tax=Streptomyces sp. NPDC048604 TaxID=3365578 RepID=UPI0037166BD7